MTYTDCGGIIVYIPNGIIGTFIQFIEQEVLLMSELLKEYLEQTSDYLSGEYNDYRDRNEHDDHRDDYYDHFD